MTAEVRALERVNRGLAAERLIGDEVVTDWFAAEEARYVEEMLSAGVSEDERRRDAALKIRVLRDLKRHLEAEASLGSAQAKKLEKRKNG